MNNNDVLRRLRYALDISNPSMIEIFQLSGCSIEQPTLIKLLKKEDDDKFISLEFVQILKCALEAAFLDNK